MGVRGERGTREAGLRRKAAALFSIIVFIALVVGAFFGDDGILDLWHEQGRTRALQAELDELRVDNGRVAEEIRALRSDPRAVEQLAREQLGLARPGETVFVLRPPRP